jgi:hypothetical protein
MVGVTGAAAVWACHWSSFTCHRTIRFSLSVASAPAHALRVPLLISFPLLVRRSLVIGGRAMGWLVSAHTPPHCVLGPSRVLQVTDGFVLSGRSSAAPLNRCAIPYCQLLFALVVWVIIPLWVVGSCGCAFAVIQSIGAAIHPASSLPWSGSGSGSLFAFFFCVYS